MCRGMEKEIGRCRHLQNRWLDFAEQPRAMYEKATWLFYLATWLAQLVERQSAVREGRGFEPQTGPTFRVLK